jgi:hypothetical protein
MTKFRSVVFASCLAFAAACGGKSSGDTAGGGGGGGEPAGSGMTCEQVAESLGGTMETTGEFEPGMVDQMMERLIETCTATAWSEETKACFASASGGEDSESCADGMTDEQRQGLLDSMGEPPGESEGE